ncbi:MAG: response regulator [Elusimicrobia bacterium]|nr:response regulator [Elusimicrobiota bacterium]MBK7545901.1 response regulator [Elusimicrobiota bacterium]MBK7574777.1 response regulator [Elusimicrobiota bacterium]MBK8125511.1 response regulator [Elusimicrobiota bacterium]MBK8423198.1 response regulator [Elusimicrobiota bacterium]
MSKTGRILVVDDEPHLLDLLVDVISEEGYHVDGVATGTAALHIARNEEYHVALLDYQLGDMTGLALSKELRRAAPNLKVILMTAHASLDMAVKAIQADVYDYMIKPIDSNHLKRSVANALEQYRLLTENQRLVDTLQKTNRELAQLNEFKSKFFSIVTHDLRSPLTSIRGYAQLILQKPDMGPESLTQFLKIIISQSDQLGNLINDLMDVVSIQSGKLRVERALSDLGELLAAVQSRLVPLANQRKVRFEVTTDTALPPLLIDKRRIDQVLTNLIGNAFKHTPEDGRVAVRAAREGAAVRVTVSDTGEGIPPEALERVFEQFFQVESHASKKEGLGLGLTIAREIITAHNGEIGVASEGVGKGAQFWFTLPAPAG